MIPRTLLTRSVQLLLSTLPCLVACAQSPTSTPAPLTNSRAPGVPAVSGREPDVQAEKDWVDNRWQATEVGPFLASTLPTPNGTVTRALSIKLGAGHDAAIAYDTVTCSPRVAWTGGFLKFSPTRFGLIDAPKIDGEPQLLYPPNPGWPDSSPKFIGIYRTAAGVTLEYHAGPTRILERPGFARVANGTAFTRSFRVEAHTQPLKLLVAPHRPKARAETESAPTYLQARWTLDDRAYVADISLGQGPTHTISEAGWVLTLQPSTTPIEFETRVWSGPTSALPDLPKVALSRAELGELKAWIEPAPSKWLPELTTQGQRGSEAEFLAVDTLTLPYANPWNALFFGAGIDFTTDGAGYLAVIHGDVWRVTGVDASLSSLKWHRYATGLFQPLGLKVRGDKVYVLGRDRITRLHDLNHDGEADFYESFFDGIDTSPGGHDYVTCLEADDAGNFYYTDPKGVHRVSPDGRTKTTLATGWRNPNGMGVSPDGKIITVAPQQGTWTPSSEISEVKLGGYYGYGGPKVSTDRPLGYDPHLCWIPHGVDNSSGSQAWVPKGSWGPLGGQMLHLLWGRCGAMLILRDTNSPNVQGAAVPLPLRFLSGPNRASFNARDEALYVAGSTGWQTSATKDGALQRVRYTRKTAMLPLAWKAHQNGIEITFNQPLDAGTAEDRGSYAVKQWNYRYSQDYGSKDWSVADPTKEGRDEVEVTAARLLPDGKTVRLEFKSLKPVMQMEIKYNVNVSSGKASRGQFWLSLNNP